MQVIHAKENFIHGRIRAFSTVLFVLMAIFMFGIGQAKAGCMPEDYDYSGCSSGGGGYIPREKPTGVLLINGGAEYTYNKDVVLTLKAKNTVAYTEFVNGSSNEDFADTSFVSDYKEGEILESGWTLGDNLEVCVKLRSKHGTTAVVCDTIELRGGVGGDNSWEFEFYLVNPDGTKPSRTQMSYKGEGVDQVNFEDTLVGVHKIADSDYNDFVVEMEQKTDGLVVRAKSVNAAWHHQVRVKVKYDGEEVEDVLLWSDSHKAVGTERNVKLER